MTLLLTACGDARETAEGARTNVVVVLVDQLRKDAADRWMPRVGALARRGIILDGMRATAPWTYPSVISLLSGLYPQQHGADGAHSDSHLSTFSADVPLLPRILREAGYATAAFVTNPFLHTWNPFHEGFETFDAHFINSQGNRRGYDDAVWTQDMFADDVDAALRSHFDARPVERPEFTYVHYIDVHGPWDDAPFEPDYESSVRWIDARIAELYAYFMDRYDGELLFFVTSDHGRALGNDEYAGDGRVLRKSKQSVHDFNLRIPFFVLPGRGVPSGVRLDGPSSNVDFVPTLLAWLGMPGPAPVAGRSLLPALRGDETLDATRPLYARMSAFGRHNDCVVQSGFKFARFFDPDTGEISEARIFDLGTDPREVKPASRDLGDWVFKVAREAGDQGIRFEPSTEALDPDTRAKLEALGYLR